MTQQGFNGNSKGWEQKKKPTKMCDRQGFTFWPSTSVGDQQLRKFSCYPKVLFCAVKVSCHFSFGLVHSPMVGGNQLGFDPSSQQFNP